MEHEVTDFYLGLDLGGTNMRLACLNQELKLIGTIRKSAWDIKITADKAVHIIVSEMNEIIEQNSLHKSKLRCIGIALAAICNRVTGNIIKWPNHPLWNGYPFKEALQKEFGVPVILEDDCNAAAIAEGHFGVGSGHRDFLYVNIGTGIGSGIIINGSCYAGSHGFAGELGHIRLTKSGPVCSCGRRGCLQAYAAGPALIKRAAELAAADGESVTISGICDIYGFAVQKKSWALQVFGEAADYLAMGIGQLVMFLDLPLIILGGGVIEAYPRFLKDIRNKINDWVLDLDRNIEVKKAGLSDCGGVFGALCLAVDYERRKLL